MVANWCERCGGNGWVVAKHDDAEFHDAWLVEHYGKRCGGSVHDCDGWHLVECPSCHGTGLKETVISYKRSA
jgi:DnaJ-class molecular chaperone